MDMTASRCSWSAKMGIHLDDGGARACDADDGGGTVRNV